MSVGQKPRYYFLLRLDDEPLFPVYTLALNSIFIRHIGQLLLRANHGLRQSTWNRCVHSKSYTIAPSAKSSRHTPQHARCSGASTENQLVPTTDAWQRPRPPTTRKHGTKTMSPSRNQKFDCIYKTRWIFYYKPPLKK